jgi:hemerythrin-like domain-containing protein
VENMEEVGMKPTQILMDEHRVIERVLASLETAARRLESGRTVRAAFFLEAADFIREFADGTHHEKEEGALFPAMKQAGVPDQGGPIGVMLSEHDEGRRLTRAMRAAAEGLAAGKPDARARLVESALAYAALLRQHIAKEDTILFPMADQVLDESQRARLSEAFETLVKAEAGTGVQEKYLALAERLEQEAKA